MVPELVLRLRGKIVARLAPGERALIGRAQTADVCIDHPSVSRLHARVTWPERSAPIVEDLHSVNGVAVDGRPVEGPVTLRDGASLELGSCVLEVELVVETPPAVLPDTDQTCVRLFCERGPRLLGMVGGPERLADLLLDLEAAGRTGTLVLEGQGQVTLAAGRVVDARTEARRGADALRELLGGARRGRYRFDLELAPCESTLDLSMKEHLRRGPVTQRLDRSRSLAS